MHSCVNTHRHTPLDDTENRNHSTVLWCSMCLQCCARQRGHNMGIVCLWLQGMHRAVSRTNNTNWTQESSRHRAAGKTCARLFTYHSASLKHCLELHKMRRQVKAYFIQGSGEVNRGARKKASMSWQGHTKCGSDSAAQFKWETKWK